VLTPLDIHNQEFRRVLRGYSEDEVDDFLDRVVADFETLLKENAQLRQEVDELKARVEQYRQLENTLHNALIVAQETAEEVKQSARKEAQLIIREAEEEAARIQRLAEQRVQEAEERLVALHREITAFRAQIRSQLEAQLEVLRVEVPLPPSLTARRERDGRPVVPLPTPAHHGGETKVAPSGLAGGAS
jgi:cell division initiation protein